MFPVHICYICRRTLSLALDWFIYKKREVSTVARPTYGGSGIAHLS